MKLPLFIVTGTSGSGKTTVIPFLREKLPEYCVFDIDSMIPEDYDIMKCNWLRVARDIAKSGRPTILCGTIIPENLKTCDQIDEFCEIFYINLDINAQVINKRLNERNWNNELIQNCVDFSVWLGKNADTSFDPPMFNIDCNQKTPNEISDKIISYIEEKL